MSTTGDAVPPDVQEQSLDPQLPSRSSDQKYAQNSGTKARTKRPPLTHFLALPLCTESSEDQLRTNLGKFRDKVLHPATPSSDHGVSQDVTSTISSSSNQMIPEAALRHPGSLHFTLGVMSLTTPALIESCTTFLRGLSIASILAAAKVDVAKQIQNETPNFHPSYSNIDEPHDQPPLHLTLTSLHALPHPQAATSLYIAPQPNTTSTLLLTAFATRLRQKFQDAGFISRDDTRPLLLHGTIVNTIYAQKGGRRGGRKNGGGGGVGGKKDGGRVGGKKGGRLRLDARDLITQWENMVWVEDMRIERVAICEMGARKVFGAAEDVEGDRDEGKKEDGDRVAVEDRGGDLRSRVEREDKRGGAAGGQELRKGASGGRKEEMEKRVVVDQVYHEVAAVAM